MTPTVFVMYNIWDIDALKNLEVFATRESAERHLADYLERVGEEEEADDYRIDEHTINY